MSVFPALLLYIIAGLTFDGAQYYFGTFDNLQSEIFTFPYFESNKLKKLPFSILSRLRSMFYPNRFVVRFVLQYFHRFSQVPSAGHRFVQLARKSGEFYCKKM